MTSPESLVIVSATTSGGLVKNLIRDNAFSTENILTLFFHISLLINVVSLTYRMLLSQVSPQYQKNIVNFVDRAQRLFELKESNFYLKHLSMSYWSLKKSISIIKRQNFFKEFAVKELLKFNTSPSDDCEKEHFYIDIKKLFEPCPDFFKRTLTKEAQ